MTPGMSGIQMCLRVVSSGAASPRAESSARATADKTTASAKRRATIRSLGLNYRCDADSHIMITLLLAMPVLGLATKMMTVPADTVSKSIVASIDARRLKQSIRASTDGGRLKKDGHRRSPSTTSSYASNTSLTLGEFRSRSCKRQLWMLGVDLRSTASFLGKPSATYAQALLLALNSARKAAPSLVPVVMLAGERRETPVPLVQAFEQLGALVLFHKLSFRADIDAVTRSSMCKASKECQQWKRVTATFFRLDLAAALAAAFPHLDADVETGYVLWTDPDVVLLQDINSCTIPKPTLASLAGDTGHEVAASGAVIYWNVSAYSTIFPGLLRYAVKHSFSLFQYALDQHLLLGFIGTTGLLSILPDIYNYKPYWGSLPKQVYGANGEVALVHMQGPKLQTALCAFGLLEKRRGAHFREGKGEQLSAATNALRQCQNGSKVFSWIAQDLSHAFLADRGHMYKQVDFRIEQQWAHSECLPHLEAALPGACRRCDTCHSLCSCRPR